MADGVQVRNGKAFEYAIAYQYYNYLKNLDLEVVFVDNPAKTVAYNYFQELSAKDQQRCLEAAYQTIDTMVKIEPGLTSQKNDKDVLSISLAEDQMGEDGDVRDVVFSRIDPNWEIGFSAKNNNDAVKHSRLSKVLDFGEKWVGVKCSQEYWDAIKPVFAILDEAKQKGYLWENIWVDKMTEIYRPILIAFRDELLKIASKNPEVPAKLVQYLIGKYPFYKIIKDDSHNLVVVKAFNIEGQLNKTVNRKKSQYSTPKIDLPSRIVEFDFLKGSDNTLVMILDRGWEISFRIHSAEKKVQSSLKFDIRLLGNPPVLFSQYLFQ